MKCVCERPCQVVSDDKVVTVPAGTVMEFEECPIHFRSLEGDGGINFVKASEEELKAANWTFEDAAKAIKDEFGIDLVKEEGIKKSEVVAQIMDARYRKVD